MPFIPFPHKGAPSQGQTDTKDADSDLERKFDFYLKALGPDIPEPDRQVKFKRWKLDRAWPSYKISVELHGGAGGGYGRPVTCHRCGVKVKARKKDGSIGRELRLPYVSHTGPGAERDAAKHNSLQLAGWIALQFTSQQLKDNPQDVIDQIRAAIEARSPGPQPQPEQAPREIPINADTLGLSGRELQVLTLLCLGMSYPQAGAVLHIQTDTVQKHGQAAKRKLGASNMTQAVYLAVSYNLVPLGHDGAALVADKEIPVLRNRQTPEIESIIG